MKKVFAALISLIVAFSMALSASAATIDMFVAGVLLDADRTVHVTIVYGSPEAAQQSTLLLLKENISLVTAQDSDFKYIDQKRVTGNCAEYEFTLPEKDRVGTYDLYVGGNKIDAPDSTKICFDMTNATTIMFKDADTNTELLPAVLVNTNIGTAINLDNYGPKVVEYEGVSYMRQSSNEKTYTPTEAIGEVVISYAVASEMTIEKVSATVIDGNEPILPLTLNAEKADGTKTTVTVSSWDLSKLTVGENTVYGTCNETDEKAVANVMVHPLSFTLADTNSKGAGDNSITFPMDMSGAFKVEFDMVINAISDTGANFGYNGTKWSGSAFNITPNGGILKVVGGDKTGTKEEVVIKDTVTKGETYRILVEADATTDTMSVYATAADGTVYSVLNKTFRKEQSPDAINTINLRGNSGAQDGDVAITNVKVSTGSIAAVTFVSETGEVVAKEYFDPSQGSYKTTAQEVYFKHADGSAKIYAIPETEATENTTVTVYPVENKYAVIEDAFIDEGKIYGINTTNANNVFVAGAAAGTDYDADRGPIVDADGASVADGTHSPTTLARNRAGLFRFPVVKATENQAVFANFYVAKWHSYTFANSNKSIRLAGYAVNDSSWITNGEQGSYVASEALLLEGFTEPMFTNAHGNSAGYITLDITEAMKKANALGLTTLTIRLNTGYGAAYIAERESCVAGGTNEGKASYLSVVSAAKTATVTGADKVTRNGSVVVNAEDGFTMVAGDTVKMYSSQSGMVAFTDDVNIYALTNGATDAVELPAGEYRAVSAGVITIDGAQVRIGNGVDSATGKVGEGSGLRFVTIIDKSDSLANFEGVTYGVKVEAEDSTEVVDIPAVKWQQEDEVYTSAVTNLAETNFNRNFTATAYVKIGDQIFYGNSVTRSIYQVARGLLETGQDDIENIDELHQSLIDVLNAYVNQTGIRLGFTTEGLKEYDKEKGAYTGDGAFFEVSDATVNGTIYSIKLTPIGDAVINTDYANEYVRINNNNSQVKALVTVEENSDGTYTLTFDATTLLN